MFGIIMWLKTQLYLFNIHFGLPNKIQCIKSKYFVFCCFQKRLKFKLESFCSFLYFNFQYTVTSKNKSKTEIVIVSSHHWFCRFLKKLYSWLLSHALKCLSPVSWNIHKVMTSRLSTLHYKCFAWLQKKYCIICICAVCHGS